MITKEELSDIKERRKTTLYYEEKEYLQYIFLNAISKYGKDFVFKGGTCLRICYGLERASEDLDFSTDIPIKDIKEIVKKCVRDFELLNIESQIYSEKEYEGNLRIEVRFNGPLYNGNLNSTNTLKIDFNKRRVFNTETKVIPKTFSDVPLFTMVVLSEKEILAEKLRALINRGEPRDLYDIWIMLNKDVIIDPELIFKKMKEEKSEIKNLKIPSKEKYEIELKNLLVHLPDYAQVEKEVRFFIKSL